MPDPEGRIKVETGRITIIHGLDQDGGQIFNVKTQGDLTYIQALGLLAAAKDNIDMQYLGDDDDGME